MSSSPTPLQWTGTPTARSGCSEPHPAWPWMSPGMGYPPHFQATVLVLHYPYCKKLFPYIQFKSFHFETISPCPIPSYPLQSVPYFLTAPFQVLKGRSQVTLKPSLLQAEQPHLSQPVLIGKVFHPLDHFCPSSWCAPTSPSLILYWGLHNCIQYSRWGLTSTE